MKIEIYLPVYRPQDVIDVSDKPILASLVKDDLIKLPNDIFMEILKVDFKSYDMRKDTLTIFTDFA